MSVFKTVYVSAVVVCLAGTSPPSRWASLGIVAQSGQPAPTGRGLYRGLGVVNGYSPAVSGRNVAFGALTDGASGMYALIDGEVIVIAATLPIDAQLRAAMQHLGAEP